MILLEPIPNLDGYYRVALMDNCIDEVDTSLIENIWEGATLLSKFETAWARALERLTPYGYVFSPDDFKAAELYIKPLWQCMRNGLAYDWAINYAVGMLERAYPFTKHTLFTHTEENIQYHLSDPVFEQAITDIAQHADSLIEFALVSFEDKRAFTKLYDFAKTNNLEQALNMMHSMDNPPVLPTSQSSYDRVRFIVVAMEMLSQAIGSVKRRHWHRIFQNISKARSEQSECLVLMGSKFSAYVYGNVGDVRGWHHLPNGIQLLGTSGRIRTLGENKKFPDMLTFFHISNGTMHVDETHFPKLSFDKENWYSPQEWVLLEKAITREPQRIYVKYDHKYAANGTVKIKGTGLLVREETIQLDEHGIGEAQLQARGHAPEIKIVEGTKTLPFGVFPSKIEEAALPWLS